MNNLGPPVPQHGGLSLERAAGPLHLVRHLLLVDPHQQGGHQVLHWGYIDCIMFNQVHRYIGDLLGRRARSCLGRCARTFKNPSRISDIEALAGEQNTDQEPSAGSSGEEGEGCGAVHPLPPLEGVPTVQASPQLLLNQPSHSRPANSSDSDSDSKDVSREDNSSESKSDSSESSDDSNSDSSTTSPWWWRRSITTSPWWWRRSSTTSPW